MAARRSISGSIKVFYTAYPILNAVEAENKGSVLVNHKAPPELMIANILPPVSRLVNSLR